MNDLVQSFALTKERGDILQGLINYRAALYGLGITVGFQWVDGSFVENIEDLEARPPNDVDVVSYVELPTGQTQMSIFPHLKPLQDRKQSKATYKVDGFVFVVPQLDIRRVCYWYSLFSHRRNGLWKGFAEVLLDPSDDQTAQDELNKIAASGFSK
ncbi:hypothetical protein QNI11_00385 [Sagittula sp. MA-2]|jgi:hypothetical protein|nr:hypothetical protein [Sagittula sp. MA-2]WHZ35478.1 hypothetical protein QNI11_00385 [Sagittula sp. MA-2]